MQNRQVDPDEIIFKLREIIKILEERKNGRYEQPSALNS